PIDRAQVPGVSLPAHASAWCPSSCCVSPGAGGPPPGGPKTTEMSSKTLTGILEWPERAEGRIRQVRDSAVLQAEDDPFVPLQLGEQLPLRHGLEVVVQVGMRRPRRRKRGGRGAPRPVVENFVSIEGMDPEAFRKAKRFEDLTVIDPQPRLT